MATKPTRRDVIGMRPSPLRQCLRRPCLAGRRAGAGRAGRPKVEYTMKKLAFDPAKVPGLSEKLLVSHYENNYAGAVQAAQRDHRAARRARHRRRRRSSWSTG